MEAGRVGTNKDLAEALNISPSVLSALKGLSKGKKRPKGVINLPWRQIVEWALRKSISIDWLLTGQEPPHRSHPPEITFQPILPRGVVSEDHMGLLRWVDLGGDYAAVPLLKDAVAAGPPSAIRDDDIQSWAIIYKDRYWMPGQPQNYTCVRVAGKSMYPVLDDGDIVAIDHSEAIKADLEALKHLNRRIVAFRTDSGITLKWLVYKEEEEVVLGVPENKEELDTTIILRGPDINTGIVGLVRWWWSKR